MSFNEEIYTIEQVVSCSTGEVVFYLSFAACLLLGFIMLSSILMSWGLLRDYNQKYYDFKFYKYFISRIDEFLIITLSPAVAGMVFIIFHSLLF